MQVFQLLLRFLMLSFFAGVVFCVNRVGGIEPRRYVLSFTGTVGGEAEVVTAPISGIRYGVATPFSAQVKIRDAWQAQYEFNNKWVRVSGDVEIDGNIVVLKSNAIIRPVLDVRKYSFTVTQPSAGGTVTALPAAGSYDYNTAITLTASPAAGWHFVHWTGGDIDGETSPAITARIVSSVDYTAVFEKNHYTLTITFPEHGTITASPAGPSYPYGTVVTLTASPDTAYRFISWTGDVSGNTASTTVMIDNHKTVSASFAEIPGVTDVVYVWKGAKGLDNGSNWANAYTNLSSAIANAGTGKTFWIAGGLYRVADSGNIASTFVPQNGTRIYGGYTGLETELGQRV